MSEPVRLVVTVDVKDKRCGPCRWWYNPQPGVCGLFDIELEVLTGGMFGTPEQMERHCRASTLRCQQCLDAEKEAKKQ